MSKKAKRALWIIVAAIVATPILVALIVITRLGTIVKIAVEQVGPRMLGVEVRLDDATVLPLRGSISLAGLDVGNPEGFKSPSFMKAKLIQAGADIGSLLKDEIHIKEIILDGPEFTFEYTGDTSNVKALMDRLESGEDEDEESIPTTERKEGALKKVKIDLIRITNARLNVILLGQSLDLKIPKIEITDIADKDGNAVAPREVVAKILTGLAGDIRKTVEASVPQLGDISKELKGMTGIAKDLGKDAKGITKDLGKDLKNLLGK